MKESKLITDIFEYPGKWFLPGCDDYTVSGTVSYSADSIRITISGPLRDPTKYQTVQAPFWLHRENEKLDTLLGTTDNGIEFTLENCVIICQTHNFIPSTKKLLEVTTYHVNSMFVGTHYASPDGRQFNQVTVKYTNFKEWVNEPGITTDQDLQAGSFTISSMTPTSHKGALIDNFEYDIWHQIDNPGLAGHRFDASISQDTVITISNKKKSTYEEFYKLHYRLQNFVMMGILYSIKPLLITATNDDTLGKNVIVYNGQVDVSDNPGMIRNDQMFLSVSNLPGKLEETLQHWLIAYGELEDAFDLFFENMTNSKLYPQDRFENVIQALEAYHRGRFDDELMEKSRYENMVNDILSKLNDQDQKDWIKKNKARGNDLSLSQKLHQLFEQFPYVFTDVDKREEFVVKVQDTRNYFAHHAKKLKEKAAENAELHYLEQRLNVLMVACMLLELGFDEPTLEGLVIKYAKRRQQFKLVWQADPYEWLV